MVSSLQLVQRNRSPSLITKLSSQTLDDYQPERWQAKWPVIYISRIRPIKSKHNSNQSTQSLLLLFFPSFLYAASRRPTISAEPCTYIAPYNQFKISMNEELNRLVKDILTKNSSNPKTAIEELFKLLNIQPNSDHHNIHKAILYSMENLHEWGNIMKYVEKWKVNDFRKDFIARMRKRLGYQELEVYEDTIEQMKRLIEQYWKTKSPKKEENMYREPINIKNFKLSTNVHPLADDKPHEKAAKVVKVEPVVEQKQQKVERPVEQPKPESTVAFTRSLESQQMDSNGSFASQSRKEKTDPLTTFTGRPPILKKKSIFQNQPKVASTVPLNSNEQNPSQSNNQKRGIANSRIANIMKRYADKEESKTTESWENFGRNKTKYEDQPKPQTKEQVFPADKLLFGSNKKSSESDLSKKIPVSPHKYDPTTKAVKIFRAQKDEKKTDNFLEFSFANSDKKDPPKSEAPPLPVVQQLSSVQNGSQPSDRFIFNDTHKESQRDNTLLIENDFQNQSFQRIHSSDTPIFVYNDSKKRRSSVNRIQSLDLELNLFDPNIKLRYFMRQMQERNGCDVLTLFHEEFQKFVNDPEQYRL